MRYEDLKVNKVKRYNNGSFDTNCGNYDENKPFTSKLIAKNVQEKDTKEIKKEIEKVITKIGGDVQLCYVKQFDCVLIAWNV